MYDARVESKSWRWPAESSEIGRPCQWLPSAEEMRIKQDTMSVKSDAHNYSGSENTTVSSQLLLIQVILKSLIASRADWNKVSYASLKFNKTWESLFIGKERIQGHLMYIEGVQKVHHPF